MKSTPEQQAAGGLGTIALNAGESYAGKFYAFKVIVAATLTTLTRNVKGASVSALAAVASGGQNIGVAEIAANETHTSGPHEYDHIVVAAGAGRVVIYLDEVSG